MSKSREILHANYIVYEFNYLQYDALESVDDTQWSVYVSNSVWFISGWFFTLKKTSAILGMDTADIKKVKPAIIKTVWEIINKVIAVGYFTLDKMDFY